MIVLEDKCFSPHVAMAQRDHIRLDWRMPYRTVERVRPVAWTCICRATVYELCQGGGQAFIRRTVQLDGAPEARETPRWLVNIPKDQG
ncbi:hypothetical protein Ppa06_41940 [Planomonospora parontospora subsp. parontospora]|uniref:Uncharacterized protein n=2 Tax=Planomonospora parontospora TaxID=58119 RepID=A0AA37BIM4_9ACTN|nr:hypothetical protein [Planomonospora parontospora]GGK77868.1 hypothetical protein GCM10010126_41570 [Planomonospora parontospora]GII10396.1 hypothetical protein Ppa06_41940 [Planomonospora parontospora subsp. parontospora]